MPQVLSVGMLKVPKAARALVQIMENWKINRQFDFEILAGNKPTLPTKPTLVSGLQQKSGVIFTP